MSGRKRASSGGGEWEGDAPAAKSLKEEMKSEPEKEPRVAEKDSSEVSREPTHSPPQFPAPAKASPGRNVYLSPHLARYLTTPSPKAASLDPGGPGEGQGLPGPRPTPRELWQTLRVASAACGFPRHAQLLSPVGVPQSVPPSKPGSYAAFLAYREPQVEKSPVKSQTPAPTTPRELGEATLAHSDSGYGGWTGCSDDETTAPVRAAETEPWQAWATRSVPREALTLSGKGGSIQKVKDREATMKRKMKKVKDRIYLAFGLVSGVASTNEVKAFCCRFGPVKSANIRVASCCHVEFGSAAGARAALEVHGRWSDGRPLVPARLPRGTGFLTLFEDWTPDGFNQPSPGLEDLVPLLDCRTLTWVKEAQCGHRFLLGLVEGTAAVGEVARFFGRCGDLVHVSPHRPPASPGGEIHLFEVVFETEAAAAEAIDRYGNWAPSAGRERAGPAVFDRGAGFLYVPKMILSPLFQKIRKSCLLNCAPSTWIPKASRHS